MFARFCSPVSLLLAVMVSLSPVLSCYAYADESATDQGVADAYSQEAQEDPDSRGDGARSSGADVDGESAASGADGSAAGEGRFPDDGASAGAGEAAQEIDGGLAEGPDDSFGSFGDDLSLPDDGIMPLGLTEVGYLDKIYFALGANNSGGSESFKPYSVSWSAIKGTIHWVASKIYVNVASIAETLSTVSSNVSRQVNYLQAIDTATKYHRSEFTSAWGYGYGGTAVINSNSPAGWLQKLKEYNVNEYYDGYTYSTAKYLAFIFRELERVNSKLNYSGSLVGGDSGDYSAARLLARVHNALYGDITYAETGNGGVRSAVSVLGYIANLIYYGNNDIMMIAGRNLYNGGLNGVEGSGLYSTARLLARLYNANVQEVTLHETGSTGYRSTAGLLGYLANLVFDTQYSDGQLIETGTSAKRSLADLLRYTANLAYLSKEKLNQISGFMQADSSLLSKGLSDILARLDLLHEDMGAGISVDTSGIESKLDKIAGLLLAAGVIENGKDLFDAVFGDLSGIGQAAAIGAIQSAMEDAFPFCVPALVKQVFGLLVFEGSAPVWEFDICGYPLVCDFAGFQLVADCTSWLSRLGLLLALLVNTRKFVFTVNGGGSS